MHRRNLAVVEHELSQLILRPLPSQRLHRLLLKQHQRSLKHSARQLTNRKHSLVLIEHNLNLLTL